MLWRQGGGCHVQWHLARRGNCHSEDPRWSLSITLEFVCGRFLICLAIMRSNSPRCHIHGNVSLLQTDIDPSIRDAVAVRLDTFPCPASRCNARFRYFGVTQKLGVTSLNHTRKNTHTNGKAATLRWAEG